MTLRIAGISRCTASPHNNYNNKRTKYWWLFDSKSAILHAMQVSQRKEKEAEREMDSSELKSGDKIIVLNGACMEAEIKDNLPVTKVANDSLFGGHVRVKKMRDVIQTNFFWSGLREGVTNFCQSCDIGKKIVSRGLVPRAPLGDMPLINQLFKRVAIDLVRPNTTASDKRHIYILTLVDYATRYLEAVPLKNIDTETVAEVLLDMYSTAG